MVSNLNRKNCLFVCLGRENHVVKTAFSLPNNNNKNRDTILNKETAWFMLYFYYLIIQVIVLSTTVFLESLFCLCMAMFHKIIVSLFLYLFNFIG